MHKKPQMKGADLFGAVLHCVTQVNWCRTPTCERIPLIAVQIVAFFPTSDHNSFSGFSLDDIVGLIHDF